LLDERALASATTNADYVVHIAGVTKAKNTREYRVANVDTTRAILSASQKSGKLKKFCLISSLTASGPSPDGIPRREEAHNAPITAYGRSKLEAEHVCNEFRGSLPTVILRPPAVYGPRDRDVFEMFKWINRGVAPIMGPRKKTLSLIHSADLARGIVDATLSDKTIGKTYFIANENPYAYTDLVSLAAEILGRKVTFLPIPIPIIYAAATIVQLASWFTSQTPVLNLDKVRDLITPHWICDIERLRSDIGFVEQISIAEGFRSTIRWYQDHRWL